MSDLEFNPWKTEEFIKTGMRPPKRVGWAMNMMAALKPGTDHYVDMPSPFKAAACYVAAKALGGKAVTRKIRKGVYRVWRTK